MKRLIIVICVLIISMVGCRHKHEFSEATCTSPKTCKECEETEGGVIEHDYAEATCEVPKTCSMCGNTEGEALEHDYIEATCEVPKTCGMCGNTEGEALEHNYIEATCETPKTCSMCGNTEGEALEHDYVEATCEVPKTCSVCGNTEGEVLEHDYVEATCKAPKTCSMCGNIEGEKLEHDYVEATCGSSKKCSLCGITEGSPLGHTTQIGLCTRCYTIQNKNLVEDIINKLEYANSLLDTAFYNQVYNMNYAYTMNEIYYALSSETYLYDQAYQLYCEAKTMCKDYEELASLKASISSAINSFPGEISNTEDSIKQYVSDLESMTVAIATCELEMVVVQELIQ